MATRTLSGVIRSLGWNLLNFSLLLFGLFIFGLIGIAVAANAGANVEQWRSVLESLCDASVIGFALSVVLIGFSCIFNWCD